MIENLSEELKLSGISKHQNESAVPKPEVPAPSQAEVEEFFSKLSKCNSKPVVLEFGSPIRSELRATEPKYIHCDGYVQKGELGTLL